MVGDGKLEVAKGIGKAAADVLGVNLFDPLPPQPVADLEVTDDGRAGAPGDRQGIADVVAVSVGDDDESAGSSFISTSVAGLSLRNGSSSTCVPSISIPKAACPYQVSLKAMSAPFVAGEKTDGWSIM